MITPTPGVVEEAEGVDDLGWGPDTLHFTGPPDIHRWEAGLMFRMSDDCSDGEVTTPIREAGRKRFCGPVEEPRLQAGLELLEGDL